MSQCVPSWDVDDNPSLPSKLTGRPHSAFLSLAPDVPTACSLDYEVAELTWENGQLAMHSLGPPRVPTKYTWDKPRAGGTLESIVNQATLLPHRKSEVDRCNYEANDFVPWFDHHRSATPSATASASATKTMDALVPCSNNNNNNNSSSNNRNINEEPSSHLLESGAGTCAVDCSTRIGSCSATAGYDGRRVAGSVHEWDQSVTGSATFGRDSRQVTVDTCEMELGVGGFTSTSVESLGNTSSGKQCTKSVTGDDRDSREACEAGDTKKAKGKYSVTNKRSRAAAIHNQSERTDKASMLDEVIEYLKQLQAQISMMSRMNMSPAMMLPMALQQQLQMSMMAPMMGMGMGMGQLMDINSMARPNIPGLPPVLHPSAFMPMSSWDGSGGDRLPAPALPDPLSTFLACQSQPMTMDTYSRMAAMYQQMHQAPAPIPKN
ncbi:hypothetical protein LguiA_010260 [Lonicera macranthoides]